MHNMWMKKGQCEICRLEADKKLAEYKRDNNITEQQIKIGKL